MTKARASGSSGARRSQVANACQACRASKVKCSGKHPTCARCTARGIDCCYDVSEEGMTRRQYLRQEYDDQRRELDSAMNVLDVLRHGSDQEATETLARIRLGQTLAEANDEIENARTMRSQEEEEEAVDAEESIDDEHSAPDSASIHSFDHQGPYPNLNRTHASPSTNSSIHPSSYWTQGPPQLPMQAFASSSSSRRPSQQHQQQEQQQQQQDVGMMESQNFAWQSPLSSQPQSAASEWSGIGVQQFEQFHFGMDDNAQPQPDGGGSGPGSVSSFGQGRRMN